jgi:radical SAM superfamily enzyme YgiQ (UPF0313 family)
MKIATLVFGGADETLGMRIVTDAVAEEIPGIEIVAATSSSAHDCDMIFVSLYWWRDVYAYLAWLNDVGIDPRKRKPLIVIGGMSAISYRPLLPYFHYACIGDGEAVAPGMIEALRDSGDLGDIPGLVDSRHPNVSVDVVCAKRLGSKLYVDLRQSKVTRIEIARGCKAKCPFCALSFTKPYRELDADIVSRLLLGSKTRRVALFAPDSSVHTGISKIEAAVSRYGKQNLASDVRLEMLMRRKTADRVRFGIEAFGARTRKRFHKVPTDEIFLDGMMHVANNVRTTRGNPIRSATLYVIGDLPGENEDDVASFWEVLRRFDDKLKERFTMFVSVSSFQPSPLTPMQHCAIDPWTRVNDWFAKTRPRFGKLVIATRGGVVRPHIRLAQALTVRGDESCSRVLNWLSTKGRGILTSSDDRDCDKIKSACRAVGFDWERLVAKRDDQLPWHNIIPAVNVSDAMKKEWMQ